MDEQVRSSRLRAYDKSIIMLKQKAESCPKDKLLELCLIDVDQCYRLSKDNFWKYVRQYLEINFDNVVKELYI